jgi:hypothetical protein
MYQDTYTDANYEDLQDNNGSYLDNIFEQTKQTDKGYNLFNKMVTMPNGRTKNKNFGVYSSSNTGNHIRDAETGEYTNYLVGSKDEDLFFKVSLSTGKCTSKNGSHTFFYLSPQHYVSCMGGILSSNNDVLCWEEKRDYRLKEMKLEKKPRAIMIK